MHAGVDVGGGAEPLVEPVAGLVEQRDEHAVDDEAGDVARADRGLAEALRERGDGLVRRVADVGRPRTISTSFISGTGFMKCMPITRSGRPDAAASFVIEIDDVFDARIASSLCRPRRGS